MLPSAFFYFVSFNTIQNISEDGITTYINLDFPTYVKNEYIKDINQLVEDFNKGVESGGFEISETGDTTRFISHSKQMTTVWGYQGTRNTLKWETDAQIGITDNYYASTNGPGNGLFCFCKVRYYGDKSEVTWETLEGRRYYLKKLIDKIIATARLTDYEIVKEK